MSKGQESRELTAEEVTGLSPAEQADWFYEHREQIARDATPAALDRVVSVRMTPDDLGAIAEAADRAGMKVSAWLRKVALEAAVSGGDTPAAVLSEAETDELAVALGQMKGIVDLLEGHGLRIGERLRKPASAQSKPVRKVVLKHGKAAAKKARRKDLKTNG